MPELSEKPDTFLNIAPGASREKMITEGAGGVEEPNAGKGWPEILAEQIEKPAEAAAARQTAEVRQPFGFSAYTPDRRAGRDQLKGAGHGNNENRKTGKLHLTEAGETRPGSRPGDGYSIFVEEPKPVSKSQEEMRPAPWWNGGGTGDNRITGTERVSGAGENFELERTNPGRIISELGEKVLDRAVMMRESASSGRSEIRMKLHPAELGELRISVIMKDENRVEALIVTEAAQAKSIIDSGSERLSETLLNNGFLLENLDVSVDNPERGIEQQDWNGSEINGTVEIDEKESNFRPEFKSRSGGINCLA
jgi:flagellar hook-length control protein FliK